MTRDLAASIGGRVQRALGVVSARTGLATFHVQTLLIVGLSVAMVAGILIALQNQSIRRQVLAEREAGIARMATSLQQNATYAALSGGRAFQIADLQKRLPDIARQLGAVDVTVSDSEGMIVASSIPSQVGSSSEASPMVDGGAVRLGAHPMPDGTFMFARPFVLSGDEHGVLETRVELASLLAAIDDATATSLLPSLVILLIALPLTAFASNRILARTYERDQKLRLEARFGSLVRHSSDLVLILEADGRIQYASPSTERILGHPPADLVGVAFRSLVHPDDAEAAERLIAELRDAGRTPLRAEWRIQRADEVWRSFETVGTNLVEEPLIGGIVLNARDVSERRALQDQLAHQAFHDPLTDLPNRALFEDRVDSALTRIPRHERGVAVFLLDLDDFKRVNDSLGHHAGDTLLIGVAERLIASIRSTDTAARLGGDEFALLLDEVDAVAIDEIVVRIEAALREPFLVDGTTVHTSASIGIATSSSGLATTRELLRGADVAMYSAKSRGKGDHVTFQPSLHEEVVQRVRLDSDLRRAVENGEFVVHYQPVVALRDREIVGTEALVRWAAPDRGLISPAAFIGLAEETGLIVPLGTFVLHQACRQMRDWQARFPDARRLSVGVNVSARQTLHPGFPQAVADALALAELPPESLTIEITEGTLMRDTETTMHQLAALKELGVRLAIDDFGTGYSSLGYLSRFQVDVLKIDKSFIDRIDTHRDARALARAIVELGRSLKLRTVAEGVERPDQADMLVRFGCELAQGFLFAPPMDATTMTERLAESLATRGDGAHPVGGALPFLI